MKNGYITEEQQVEIGSVPIFMDVSLRLRGDINFDAKVNARDKAAIIGIIKGV